MRRRLNYANVTATLALLFAMSGGALAAKHYLINSTKQINPKVLKALKGKEGPRGLTGATGKEGGPGKEGREGPAGPFPTGNAPGHITIRGTYAAGGTVSGAAQFGWDQISFGFQFAAAPAGHFVAKGATPPAECPGSATNPQASPGHLCVYEAEHGSEASTAIFDPSTGKIGETNRWGAGVFMSSGKSGSIYSYGTWAATTP